MSVKRHYFRSISDWATSGLRYTNFSVGKMFTEVQMECIVLLLINNNREIEKLLLWRWYRPTAISSCVF